MYRKERDWHKAVHYYEQVIKIDSRDLYALTGLYCIYFLGLSDENKAAETEAKIAIIEPTKKTLLMKLGDAYKHEQRFADASHCYRQLIAIDPSNSAAQIKLQEMHST